MSIPVRIVELEHAVHERGSTAYVTTVDERGWPHVVQACVQWDRDGLVAGVGERTARFARTQPHGETAGAALAAHPDVDKVAFTGSTEVGKLILQAAAGNLKKVSLELGGKSPAIVFPDANLDLAIPGAASAIFFNHGQCCCAGSRLYIHESIFDKVVDGVAGVAKQIKVGSGMDSSTEMGPLVSDEQLGRVMGYIDAGKREGATVVTGGKKAGGNGGYFVEPTVLISEAGQLHDADG